MMTFDEMILASQILSNIADENFDIDFPTKDKSRAKRRKKTVAKERNRRHRLNACYFWLNEDDGKPISEWSKRYLKKTRTLGCYESNPMMGDHYSDKKWYDSTNKERVEENASIDMRDYLCDPSPIVIPIVMAEDDGEARCWSF